MRRQKPFSVVFGLLAIGALWLLASCGKKDIPVSTETPKFKCWVVVQGESMLPTFPQERVYALAETTPYDQLKVGDTVLFWDYKRGPNSFTHHRLVAKQGGNWISKGDNKETNTRVDDSWVTRDNYIMRTTGFYTKELK